MNTKTLRRSFLLFLLLNFLVSRAGRGEEPLRGPLPENQRNIIQYLAEHHRELRREVTLQEDGYVASTTTANKEVAARLKEHIAYMKKRMESGAMVRRWDPAFVELIKFHDQITTNVSYLEDGVRVVVTGQTREAVKVAQNHARIVTGFAEKGAAAVGDRHDPVSGPGEPPVKAETPIPETAELKPHAPEQMTVRGILKHFPQDVKSVQAWLGNEFMVGETPILATKSVPAEELRKLAGVSVTIDGVWNPGKKWEPTGEEKLLSIPIDPLQKPVILGSGLEASAIARTDQ